MNTHILQTRAVPRLGLSRTEVALSIGVSPGSVDKMVEEGVLPQPRIWHTRKIWVASEIEAALQRLPERGTENKGRSGHFDGAAL